MPNLVDKDRGEGDEEEEEEEEEHETDPEMAAETNAKAHANTQAEAAALPVQQKPVGNIFLGVHLPVGFPVGWKWVPGDRDEIHA